MAEILAFVLMCIVLLVHRWLMDRHYRRMSDLYAESSELTERLVASNDRQTASNEHLTEVMVKAAEVTESFRCALENRDARAWVATITGVKEWNDMRERN